MKKLKSWLFDPVRTRMITEFYSPENDEWIRVHLQESRFGILIRKIIPNALLTVLLIAITILLISATTLLIQAVPR